MGLKQSGHICDKLITHGLAADTPCAIIENGTRPEQRVLSGTLATLPELAKGAVSPALIVVGSVASLSEHLQWFNQ